MPTVKESRLVAAIGVGGVVAGAVASGSVWRSHCITKAVLSRIGKERVTIGYRPVEQGRLVCSRPVLDRP
jgi:hypothetical protein